MGIDEWAGKADKIQRFVTCNGPRLHVGGVPMLLQ